LHLIALNEPMNGNMKGVRGADFECYKQARHAGFTTTFRAFLSSQVQDLNKIVHYSDHQTPVVNARGHRLFDTWTHIFDDSRLATNASLLSFSAKNVLNDVAW
jgi:hypothetical protein